jgi:hypothetical protein
MIEQVIQWLKDGGEHEAASSVSQCSLNLIFVGPLFQLGSLREHDMFDVSIEAPRRIVRHIENPDWPLKDQIESAIRACARTTDHFIRDIAWVPRFADLKTPVEQQVSAVLAKVDSEHIHKAWEKALGRKNTDPEGAITAARALVESVSRHILEKAGMAYPTDGDLPKLYRLTAERLHLAPNQHTPGTVRRILGNCQAVVNGLASLRNELGDAHGNSSGEIGPDPSHAELAVNLAGTLATYLVWVWEKSIPAK